ncbi:hypothetical protein HBA54_27995 [Pelagibius litoralis]|uniref:CARDB domain-containing protein n=1 Tax=Pelagibius litoralis TaxID=374515 RepID=A0A967KIM2_9PROT|nr:hypothetical protein [Pelagibius litoralis]NIA72436.1 hypothetical protein [Pelagibius litoralis]
MRKSTVSTLTLAAVAAVTLAAPLSNDSAAQSTKEQVRPIPAQIKIIKPSEPPRQPVLKTNPQPGKPRPGTGRPTTDGPDTPSQLANLVVIPFYNNSHNLPQGFPEHSFCVKNPAGGAPNQIKFWIRNAGGSDSGAFQWTPSFPNAGAAPANIAVNVPANGQILITQGIPNGCYTPGFNATCQFSISLDDHDEVEEWSEANTFANLCVGPAG